LFEHIDLLTALHVQKGAFDGTMERKCGVVHNNAVARRGADWQIILERNLA
jgi:hypothetical protein